MSIGLVCGTRICITNKSPGAAASLVASWVSHFLTGQIRKHLAPVSTNNSHHHHRLLPVILQGGPIQQNRMQGNHCIMILLNPYPDPHPRRPTAPAISQLPIRAALIDGSLAGPVFTRPGQLRWASGGGQGFPSAARVSIYGRFLFWVQVFGPALLLLSPRLHQGRVNGKFEFPLL